MNSNADLLLASLKASDEPILRACANFAETGSMARRRTADEIEQLLEQYRASELTQTEYCRQTGTVLSTLGRYLRECNRSKQRLVRVKLEGSAEPSTGFMLMLGNGRRIASDWAFKDTELARLIRIAETA